MPVHEPIDVLALILGLAGLIVGGGLILIGNSWGMLGVPVWFLCVIFLKRP